MSATVCVVIPALNEGKGRLAETIASARQADQIIVVDGGSTDNTVEIAQSLGVRCVLAERGRASQMNAGAQAASASILLFLHADVLLPPNWKDQVVAACYGTNAWGRFNVQFDSRGDSTDRRLLKTIAAFMNWRSRLSGISTGDQCQFFSRDLFEKVGGFPPIKLMEDIAISRSAKRYSQPHNLTSHALVSPRRWRQHGHWKTIFLMWQLRWRYWRGESADSLHRRYYG